MEYSYQDLRRAIDEGKIPTLIFLAYEEAYLVRQLERRLLEALVPESLRALDFLKLTGEEAQKLSLEKLQAEVSTPPFMASRKLILVQDSELFKFQNRQKTYEEAMKRAWLQFFQSIPAHCCLVFREKEIYWRQKKFWSEVSDLGAIVKVSQADEASLEQWLNALSSREGLRLERAAARELIERAEGQMDRLSAEFGKLSHIAAARELAGIDLALVEECAAPNLQADVFKLLDKLAAGRLYEALELKERLLMRKEPMQLIQFMLARKIRQLLVAKSCKTATEIAERLKVPPFVSRRLEAEARPFSTQDLVAKYRTLFQIDWQIKQGKMSAEVGFDLAILELGQASICDRIKRT